MPTYQYACTQCGHNFEKVQSFSDDALEHCPECNGRLRKVFNAVGVVFKGSGFYRTDSRATGSSNSSSTPSKTSTSDSSSGSSSSDSSSGSPNASASASSGASSSGSSTSAASSSSSSSG